MSAQPCPCGGERYDRCCGPFHAGAPAPDAARLMRSRYSAYVMELGDYLLATWHPTHRPAQLDLDDPPGQRTTWLGLDVKSHRTTGPDTAEVEFIARYRIGGGKAVRMHERSRFVREEGRWLYLDGDTPA